MIQDNLFTGDEAREEMMEGIRKVAQAVGSTMGTSGSNAIIEAIENPGHLLTNDGYTIANSIVFSDPLQEMGRKILTEAINRANRASGDLSSTTCVLTHAILEEGKEHLDRDSAMNIKRSLEECLKPLEASLMASKRDIVSEDGTINMKLLEQVATISAEDLLIGANIADIYSKIGRGGIIHWDVSKTVEDSYTIGRGITIDGAGVMSPYMCDATESGQSTNQIRVRNPYILITKQKIASAADLNTLAADLNGREIKDLIIFADEVDPLVIPDIVKTRMMRGFRIAIVKMPVLWKDWWFEDLALATGAKIVDPSAGFPMKMVKVEHLGRCGDIIIERDATYIDGINDLTTHIEALKAEATEETELRASRLNTKTARYFVGAQSDSALSYRRLKVEDAISSAYHALNGGIVAGGGSALVQAAYNIPVTTVGGQILTAALRAPAQQIAANAAHPDMEIDKRYLDGNGFDTKTDTFVNMFEAGIVDPVDVVLNACKSAISVAASVLTANTAIILPRMEESQRPSR